MKKYYSVLLLFLAGCGAVPASALESARLLSTPVMSTVTPIPTATIDYQETAIVAKSTSDEAMRINVQVTAEQDRRNFEQAVWTVTAEYLFYQQQSMTQQAGQFTATAYATSMPATQAQQARINSARETEIHMTIIAPTQVYAMAQSQTYAKNADKIQAAELAMEIAFSIMLVSIGMAVVFLTIAKLSERPKPPSDTEYKIPNLNAPIIQPIAQVVAPVETVLRVTHDSASAYSSMSRMVVPCTPEQFTALVTGVLSEGKSLAFNVWEGADSPFTRDEFTLVRNWMLSNRLAQSAGQGSLILSADGESLFIEWLNSQNLPENYKFENGVIA